MNEIEIDNFMLSDPYICNVYRGIFSADEIQNIVPGIYVFNTDPAFLPGTHWVALSLDNSKIVNYFDSFGNKPFSQLETAIRNSGLSYRFGDNQLQSNYSDVCGDYCILFAFFMSRGYSLDYFLRLFSMNTSVNDVMVQL